MQNPSQITEHHLPYTITQPPDTGEPSHLNLSQYSIYLPQIYVRLSWPWCWLVASS